MASGGGVIFIGANPGVLLYDDAGPACFASIWRSEWSPGGAGDIAIVVDRRSWHGFGCNRRLGEYLAETFTQWFPEVADLAPLSRLAWTECDLTIGLDAIRGVRATGPGVEVTIGDPIRMVPISTAFPLGDDVVSLSNVYVPCRHGAIVIGDEGVEGMPRIDGESSSAFLALAEVWSKTE